MTDGERRARVALSFLAKPGDPVFGAAQRTRTTSEVLPLVLWLRGTADLRLTCVNSVAVVGSRAATGYGNHVAVEMAATLAEHGVGVVSGPPHTRTQP